MIITVEAILATDPCPPYPPDRIRELVGDGLDPADPATLEVVLELPPDDARWVLSKLLTTADAVVWAQACADRAGMYAAESAVASVAQYADAAARCARYAAHSARSARYAAASAAASAAAETSEDAGHASYYAARCASLCAAATNVASRYAAAEHKTACQHALALLASS